MINQRRLPTTASTKLKPESVGEAKPNNKKKTTAAKTAKRVSDRDVVELLPKQNGKSVCLRHLSEVSCWSKVEGRCVADDRCHFMPNSKLPTSLEKHMMAKGWGGISSKFPHLKQ